MSCTVGVGEQFAERGQTDLPNPDVLVPVPAGAECLLRVVGVDRPQPASPERSHQLVQRGGHPPWSRQVMSCGEVMAGVQTDTERWMVGERREVIPEICDGRAERLSLPSHGLE